MDRELIKWFPSVITQLVIEYTPENLMEMFARHLSKSDPIYVQHNDGHFHVTKTGQYHPDDIEIYGTRRTTIMTIKIKTADFAGCIYDGLPVPSSFPGSDWIGVIRSLKEMLENNQRWAQIASQIFNWPLAETTC